MIGGSSGSPGAGSSPHALADPGELAAIARSVAEQARAGEEVDVMVSTGRTTQVKVYGAEVESFTSAEAFGVGIRVISGHRQGFASAGSLAPDVIAETLAEARDNLTFGEVDEFYGLAAPDGVEAVLHDHWDESLVSLSAETKIATALELERRCLSADPRISGVRTTAWSDGAGVGAYASSAGVCIAQRAASCSVGAQPLAVADGETQIGHAGDAARSLAGLDLDRVVSESVDRATRLLGAVKPSSSRLAIVLEPRLVDALLGIVAQMLDGESVLKGRSPFADRVGEQVASPLLTLVDDPTRTESIAADSWDGEGLACRRNGLIDAGILGPFLQNSYTGRRSGTASTGSAVRSTRGLPGVGPQLLVMDPGTRRLDELIADCDHGLFVNSLAGLHSGVNPVSGDFSVGADGLMIRQGTLGEPVREVTIASTIQRLLADIVAVGSDFEWLPGGDGMAPLVIADVAMSGA